MSRLRLHVPTIAHLGLIVLVAVAAMSTQNNLLFWILGMLVAAFVLSWLIAALMIRSLEIRRLDPHYGAVGEPLIVRYAVTNRSRFLSVFGISITELPGAPGPRPPGRNGRTGGAWGAGGWRRLMKPASAWVMHVAPRETVHGEAIFWPTRRGPATFERLRVSTIFPLGIIRKSIARSQPQHTLIYPMLYELRSGVLKSLAPAGLMGNKVSQHSGAGDDYYGMREFKPGDSLRRVAWKRAAKIDDLVSIERAAPSPAKLRVVLDLSTPTAKLQSARGDVEANRDLEERAICLAGSVVHAADVDGYEVGLTVLGFPVEPIAIRRNRWHVHKIMAALAALDLDAERTAPVQAAMRDVERAGLVVIAPDRTRVLAGREDAWHLTAAHLDALAVRPMGWSEAGAALAATSEAMAQEREPQPARAREAAA